MEAHSLNDASGCQNQAKPDQAPILTPVMPELTCHELSTPPELKPKRHYFINEIVEWKLTQYLWTGCTKVELRDQVMSHASELIRQVIRKQGLHTIYPGHEESAFGDLLQVGWCVTPDSILFTDNGMATIGDLVGTAKEGNCDFGVFGRDGVNKAAYYCRRPAAETFKLKLKQDYKLELTGEHPLWVMRDDGPDWVKTDQIRENDLVAVQYGQRAFGTSNAVTFKPKRKAIHKWWPTEITPDLAYVIGLVIAEGSLNKQDVVIYNYDPDVIAFLNSQPAGLAFKYEGDGRNACDRVAFVDFLDQLGLSHGINCYTKFIPSRMLTCTEEVVTAMLQGMFDGDGHSSQFNGEVGYSSSSQRLIDQLRVVLLNYGMLSKSTTSNRGEVVGPKGALHTPATAYQLRLPTTDSKLFYETIGFRIPYKQAKAIHLSDDPFTLIDECTTGLLQSKLATLSKRDLREAKLPGKHLLRRKKRFTQRTAERLNDLIKDEAISYRINTGTMLKLVWLPVLSITRGFAETININVPVSESYTANGIVTHNCQVERTLYKYRAKAHCRHCFTLTKPSDSSLYEPGESEYGVKTMKEVLALNHHVCPHCKAKLSARPRIEAVQGLYGGSESILYRGISKVFNMWSQIAKTVILAYIKKEGRDRKNSGSYVGHLSNRSRPSSNAMDRFMIEAREVCKYNSDYLRVLDTLATLVETDERPYDGIISKLAEQSGVQRPTVLAFMKYIKLRSFEFTDAPLNNTIDMVRNERRRINRVEFDEDA